MDCFRENRTAPAIASLLLVGFASVSLADEPPLPELQSPPHQIRRPVSPSIWRRDELQQIVAQEAVDALLTNLQNDQAYPERISGAVFGPEDFELIVSNPRTTKLVVLLAQLPASEVRLKKASRV